MGSSAKKSNGSRFTALLQQRDGKAFEKLVELATPVLLAKAKRFLRNDEDAADAVQDTFLLVFMSIESFRGDSSIMTWVHRILINNCLMKLRSSAGKNCVSMDSIDMDARGSYLSSRLEPAAPETDCKLETAETKTLVHKCIRQLPPEYRTIIRLRDFEQLDTDQTAVVLGIAPGAVKTRLYRARQALRGLIESVPQSGDDSSEIQRNLAPAFASNN
ncbi:MAG: sigma-70 family RNA polymerase sigma factor [Pirellulaceae bacterium]